MRALFTPIVFVLCSAISAAQVPSAINVNGYLTDPAGRPVPDGSSNVRLTLWAGPGGGQSVSNEPHTVSGATFTLDHSPLVAASESVKNSDGTVTYQRGVAYTIDNTSGVVTRASTAAMPDGTILKVSYQWTYSSSWSQVQAVQTQSGLFNSQLAMNWGYLTGSDWLGIEVQRNGNWESLSPRYQLASAPYAMKVGTVAGALGGTISGDVTVTGGLTASKTAAGTGASYRTGLPPFYMNIVRPGVLGTGVTGAAGEAAGVSAVGANNGTGLALDVQGKANVSGALNANGGLNVTGSLAGIGGPLVVSTDMSTAGRLSVTGDLVARGFMKPDMDFDQAMWKGQSSKDFSMGNTSTDRVADWIIDVRQAWSETGTDGVRHTYFQTMDPSMWRLDIKESTGDITLHVDFGGPSTKDFELYVRLWKVRR